MLVSEMNGIRPVDAGRQDCHDLHSWGPGVRQCYIIHYIISGKGTFTCGKKTYTLTAGQSFLICPEQVVQYAPDENEPWEYVWVDFVGEQCRQILARSVLNPQQPAAPPLRQERLLPYFERLCQMEQPGGRRSAACASGRVPGSGGAAAGGEKEGRSADHGSDGSDCRRVSQE